MRFPRSYFMLIIVCLGLNWSCKKDFMVEDLPIELVGEWRLTGLWDNCESSGTWPDCLSEFVPESEYTLKIKKNGRIRSFENDNEIWCNKITELNHFVPSIADRRYGRYKREVVAGDVFFLYLNDNGNIAIPNLPDPTLTEADNSEVKGLFAVYERQ